MYCPRRISIPIDSPPDIWEEENGSRICSYCGSQHPDEFMSDVENGATITPTDKDYKVYGKDHKKFYFPHLNRPQQNRLIDLLNLRKINFSTPGYFYVLPYFMVEAQ